MKNHELIKLSTFKLKTYYDGSVLPQWAKDTIKFIKKKKELGVDVDDLEKHLKRLNNLESKHRPLVITESLFSMEGTSPALEKISKLCVKYNAKLLVDEAHALGVLGPAGRGLCYELKEPVTMISGTFGKAFGSGVAFLACSKKIREH